MTIQRPLTGAETVRGASVGAHCSSVRPSPTMSSATPPTDRSTISPGEMPGTSAIAIRPAAMPMKPRSEAPPRMRAPSRHHQGGSSPPATWGSV